MARLATLSELKVNKEDWSGVQLGVRVVGGNVMPTLPDGKLLEGVRSCSVDSSVSDITTMTITVVIRNGQ